MSYDIHTFIMQESHCAHMVLLLYAVKAFLTFCFVFSDRKTGTEETIFVTVII